MFITRQTHALYGVSVKVRSTLSSIFDLPAKAVLLSIFFIVSQKQNSGHILQC